MAVAAEGASVSILGDLCEGCMYLDLHREHGRRRREFDEGDSNRDDAERIAQEWDGWWITPHVNILQHDSEHRLSGGSGKHSAEGKKRRLSGKALRINQAEPVQPAPEEPKKEVLYAQIQHFHNAHDGVKGAGSAKSMEQKLQEYKQRKESTTSTSNTTTMTGASKARATSERRVTRPTASSTSKSVAAAATAAASTAPRGTSSVTTTAGRVPSRPPLQNRTNTARATTRAVAGATVAKTATMQPAKRARTEEIEQPKARATRTTAARTTTAPTAPATRRPVRKTQQEDTEDMVRQLLAEHNKKFKQSHTYEPRQHSVRETRMWEQRTGKKYYDLSATDREAANQEIAEFKMASQRC